MKQNPVYNREMRVSSRSLKPPLSLFCLMVSYFSDSFKYVFCSHAGKGHGKYPVQQFYGSV